METKKDFVRDNAYLIIATVFAAGVLFGEFEYLNMIMDHVIEKIEELTRMHHELEHRVIELEKCNN